MNPASASRCIALAMLAVASLPAWAGRDCDAPPEAWQPGSAVQALAQRNGWQLERLKIDDGCYEIKGRDADGRRLRAKVDPATLKIISLKREHEGRGGPHRRGVPPSLPPSGASTSLRTSAWTPGSA